ncbi:MAG: hypothetical protein NW216_11480 [Hyphomicrobium sp.]|nr:hypothetical protein [Hyphomicrobium sp.]
MLKLAGLGVWGIAMTVGGYVIVKELDRIGSGSVNAADHTAPETIVTDVMRVPIMAGAMPAGYVLLDLSIDVDGKTAAGFAGKLKSIAVDEAFRTVYETASIDFRKAQKSDLTSMLDEIGKRIDARVGAGGVEDIRINEFMYAPPRHSSGP